jgi:hypothetical protein
MSDKTECQITEGSIYSRVPNICTWDSAVYSYEVLCMIGHRFQQQFHCCHGQVVHTFALNFGGPLFKSQPVDWLSRLYCEFPQFLQVNASIVP